MTPEKLCELMNLYFTPMTKIILESKGVVDKFIGDAIMAFWGAPVEIPNSADAACEASLKMLYQLDRLRTDFPKMGLPVIDIGIGLNTGPMSVGNMGSDERFCYTVMGDNVNLGSRLEGLTKEYGIKIMVSDRTYAKVSRKDFHLRDLDTIRVKGKLEPVRVYELMRPDSLGQAREALLREFTGSFNEARKAYLSRDWASAQKLFMDCMTIRPDDKPVGMYMERIVQLKAMNLDETWDGVKTFKHK
jgi:adenylate cyclase